MLLAIVCALAASTALSAAARVSVSGSPPAPTLRQQKALNHSFSLFMHYGLCSYSPTHCSWDIPISDPSIFNPQSLDTDSWMQAALAVNATQICLTVRHVDGFSLWQTKSTNYSVAASPWKNGTGDVVAEFVASARTAGISPCFYIILGFNVYANTTGVPPDVYLQQQVTALTELLTNYGTIDR
jgi:alpha-L-fucosidase